MTRINLVPPTELHRGHLAAEYYELPEIFRLVRMRQDKGQGPRDCPIPPTYRMGTGHKMFFYDKLLWLANRYDILVAEMRRRHYHPDPILLYTVYEDLASHWWNNWAPSREEMRISRDRIAQRSREIGWS